FCAPLVGSDSSSSGKYVTFCPAISFGSAATVLLCGWPSAAPGPDALMVMPTLICACALPALSTTAASATIQPLLPSMKLFLRFVVVLLVFNSNTSCRRGRDSFRPDGDPWRSRPASPAW